MAKRLIALLCACVLVFSGCANQPDEQVEQAEAEPTPAKPAELTLKPLNDYSWDELSRISQRIAEAPDDETARAVAQEFGLVEEDGTLTTQTKQIVLDQTRALDVRLAGIRHDNLSDGSGKAGLTFMTVGAWDVRAMNTGGGIEGGWEQSDLRSAISDEFVPLLDDDLASVIVEVDKRTNNVGFTVSPDDVSTTSDRVWLFSVREICGDVTWDVDEYQGRWGSSYEIDQVLNAEGEQYQVFAQEGVSGESDPHGILSLEQSTGAMPWWYRSVFPFDWMGYGPTGVTGYVCQVNASGFPESLGDPQVPAGVVLGFCV